MRRHFLRPWPLPDIQLLSGCLHHESQPLPETLPDRHRPSLRSSPASRSLGRRISGPRSLSHRFWSTAEVPELSFCRSATLPALAPFFSRAESLFSLCAALAPELIAAHRFAKEGLPCQKQQKTQNILSVRRSTFQCTARNHPHIWNLGKQSSTMHVSAMLVEIVALDHLRLVPWICDFKATYLATGRWPSRTQTHMINIAMEILPSLKINGQCISPLSTTRSSQLFVAKNGVPSFWGLPCLHSHLGVDIKINIAKQKNSHNWNRIETVILYYFRNTNLGCGLIIFHHVPSFFLLFHGYPGI